MNRLSLLILSTLFFFSSLYAGIAHVTLFDKEDATVSPRFGKEFFITSNVAYGSHPKQSFDVYAPKKGTTLSPVIFMVHGGAWKMGDKASKSVVKNKVDYWVKKGFIVISTNYRLLPEASVLEQASDIRLALNAAQMRAASWGGDKDKFILMGHSAGAHLISLVATKASLPILGAISLDSAALDVEKIMQFKHMRLYDEAFGKDASTWKALSPFYALEQGAKPYLLVCSTKRDDSCAQAEVFASKAKTLGVHASILHQNMTHKEINETLGISEKYTLRVEEFINTLLTP